MFSLINDGIRTAAPIDSLLPKRKVEKSQAIEPVNPVATKLPTENPLLNQNKRQHDLLVYNQNKGGEPRRPALYARQIMSSPVVTLSLDHTLQDAWTLFKDRRFRHIPIVYADTQRIAGILSDRDILRESSVLNESNRENILSTPLDIICIKTVLTATDQSSIRDIAETLLNKRLGAIPIINEDLQVAGIITRSDILRTVINQAPLELWA